MSQTIILAMLAAVAAVDQVPTPSTPAYADCIAIHDRTASDAKRTHDCVGAQVLMLMDAGRSDEQIKTEAASACKAETQSVKADILECKPATAGLDARLDRIDADGTAAYVPYARDRPWEAWTMWSPSLCRMDQPAFLEVAFSGASCARQWIKTTDRPGFTPGQLASAALAACARPRAAMGRRLTTCFGPQKAKSLMPSFDIFIQERALNPVLSDRFDHSSSKIWMGGALEPAVSDYFACIAVESRAAVAGGADHLGAFGAAARICDPERHAVDRVAQSVAHGIGLPAAEAAVALADTDRQAGVIAEREAAAARAER